MTGSPVARGSGTTDSRSVDQAVRVTVPVPLAEVAGAILMGLLGPFEQIDSGAGDTAALVFYPAPDTTPSDAELLAALPSAGRSAGRVQVERYEVLRDWVESWKEHIHPVVVGEVRIRPPWEPPPTREAPGGTGTGGAGLVDVVINPGLGFGTGLHPTTRGTLTLLQEAQPEEVKPADRQGRGGHPQRFVGPLVDAGTGSGVLAIAAAKLGWGPVFAFDNDLMALNSARENVTANGVHGVVEVRHVDVAGASPYWFSEATVLANMTLEPVLALIRRLAHNAPPHTGIAPEVSRPFRLVVSGILAGVQEREVVSMAGLCGFGLGRRLQETEWVTMEFWPLEVTGC